MSLRNKVAKLLHAAAETVMADPFRKMNTPRDSGQSDSEGAQMVDFRADRFASGPQTGYVMTTPGYPSTNTVDVSIKEQPVVRIEVSPKSVVDELRKPPTNISLAGLDAKIIILRTKRELVVQRYSAEHLDFMIMAMTARKKYDKKSRAAKCTYREFFSRYDTTDELKIKALLDKYALLMKSADLFVPEFPDEAITAMDICSRATKELTGKTPHFYVIAGEKDFAAANDRRDPILLAQSPFGMYYYILGAWDEEMVYLPEL